MKVIARPIGTGKTRELMEEALAHDGVILTINKRALQKKAWDYGFDHLHIIDLADLLYDEDFDASHPIYVHKIADVMEEFLRADFGAQLGGFSVTMEDSK